MNDLLKLHKQMYDVRWSVVEGDSKQLEKEFMSMVKLEGVDLEKVNEMLEQLYVPPYQEDLLPDHLKPKQHGGKREGAGRKSLGVTKRVALTLPEETWKKIEQDVKDQDIKQSALLRNIIENHYKTKLVSHFDMDLYCGSCKKVTNHNVVEIDASDDYEEHIIIILIAMFVRMDWKFMRTNFKGWQKLIEGGLNSYD